MRHCLFLSAGLSALACSSAALAQTPAEAVATENVGPAPSRSDSYDAAYFASYAPRSALDMVRRLPGFTLDLGNTELRGFSGAAGNVVIDGQRPSSKSENLEAVLARIPASRVTRIEVGPGDLVGAQYAGKAQVANVILGAGGAGLEGTTTASARRLYTGKIVPDASASLELSRGPSTFNLSAGFGHSVQINRGPDHVTDELSGELLERRFKDNFYYNYDPFISGSWALEQAPNRAIRFNLRWQPSKFDLRQNNRAEPVGGVPHDDNLFQHYRTPIFEVGGDITRPLAGGTIKLVGLATRRKRDNYDAYFGRDGLVENGAPITGGFEQIQKAQRDETIARLSWSRSNLAGFSVETGAEAALNVLDNQLDIFLIEEDGGRLPIQLPIADATVKEKRAEIYASAGRNLSSALRLDGGINFEFSDLKVRGDATADRRLSFLKPNLTLDWKGGQGWHAQLAVRRTVAQLDFYDFLSLADLKTDTVSGGNQNLEPQRTWEARLTIDRPILRSGVAKLELGYDLVSKLQDRILVTDDDGRTFDSPGNLGTGRRMFAHLTLDAPLDMVWKGLRAKFDGVVARTRVEDPISHRLRRFSGYFPNWEWSVSVRRDSGAFSYGFSILDNQRTGVFRTDELDFSFNNQPFATAFVEYRPGPRTTLTFDVDNAIATHGLLERLIYFPNRVAPVSVTRELRDRNSSPSFGFTLKQTFGSGGVAK